MSRGEILNVPASRHRSRVAVVVNQHVNAGDVIGYVGATGYATGPHLHFEVRLSGNPVDPTSYIS